MDLQHQGPSDRTQLVESALFRSPRVRGSSDTILSIACDSNFLSLFDQCDAAKLHGERAQP